MKGSKSQYVMEEKFQFHSATTLQISTQKLREIQSNLALRTVSVRSILVLKLKNVLILTVIDYIKMVFGDLVLEKVLVS